MTKTIILVNKGNISKLRIVGQREKNNCKMIHWKVDFVLRVILKLSVNEALILKGGFDEQYNFLNDIQITILKYL